MPTVLFVVNEAYFFVSHRLPVARAAARCGLEVHVAAPADHVWAPDGFDVDEIEKAGFQYHSIRLSRRGKNIAAEARSFFDIYRVMRLVRPDLVHFLTIKPTLYGGVAARLLGIPAMVVGLTGLGQVFVEQRPQTRLIRLVVARLLGFIARHPNSRLIVQNQGDWDTLLDRGVKASKLALVRGSGVSLHEYRKVPEPDDVPLVILPSRLIWEKGVREFVMAAAKLKASGVVARFALVGDTKTSNPRSVPRAQLENWVQEGTIEWWGRRTDMPSVYAQCHIVCLPTTYGEGVPRALIEAAACGRPIVATDTHGCREVVRDAYNGILVKSNDVAGLEDALRRLINDPELRSRYGERGRAIVARELSEESVVGLTMDIYAKLLRLPLNLSEATRSV